MTLVVFDHMVQRPTAVHALDGSTIYVENEGGKLPQTVPRGITVIPTYGFTSEARLAQVVNGGRVPRGIGAILYDNEDWSQTPPPERLDPVHYYQLAGTIAHQHGYRFVATPGWVPGYRGLLTPGLTVRHSAAQLIPEIAGYADVVDIQGQKSDFVQNPASYAAWVKPIASAARQANPHIVVLSGLSTHPQNLVVTSAQLMALAHSVSGVVDGFWLNVPSSTPRRPGPPQYGTAEAFVASLG